MKIPFPKVKINSLLNSLNDNTKFIIINGPSGSGKTFFLQNVCSQNNIQLEYIENIKKFTKFINKKTVGYTDLESKNEIFEVLKNKFVNKIVIETRCSLTKKEIENNNCKKEFNRKLDKTEIFKNNNKKLEKNEIYKNNYENLNKNHCKNDNFENNDKFKSNKILNNIDFIKNDCNNDYFKNYDKFKSNKILNNIDFIKNNHKVESNKKDYKKENNKNTYKNNDEKEKKIKYEDSFYDDLFSDNEIIEYSIVNLISLNKFTDLKVRKLSPDYKIIDGNLHRLKMVHILKEENKNFDFYHFLGKIFYSTKEDKTRKIEVKKIYKKYNSNKIIDYFRENVIDFLDLNELQSIFDIFSETEKYESDYIILPILQLFDADKMKQNAFRGFKSLENYKK